MNEIPQRLLGIFQTEHAEHLQQMRSLLAIFEQTGGSGNRGAELDEIFRRAHTLKGAAGVVNLKPVERVAHRLETLFAEARSGSVGLGHEAVRVSHLALDSTEDYMAALRGNQAADTKAAVQAIEQLLGMRGGPVPKPAPAEPPAAGQVSPAPAISSSFQQEDLVRLSRVALDQFGRSVGQLMVELSALNSLTEQVGEIAGHIREMERQSDRIRRTAAAPLRHLAGQAQYAPVVRYVDWIEQTLQNLVRQTRTTQRLQQHNRWAIRSSCERLRQDMLTARMVPSESAFEGFHKMARDLARDQRKEIEFRMIGGQVLADRMVLQALRDPVMHLLRNAISHGIETPQERTANGKAASGSVTLRVSAAERELRVVMEDDGRGINLLKVGEVAVRGGLLSAAELADRSPEQLARLIFEPGFSTAPAVTEVSGRGMGLSVVYEAMRRLQGDVEVVRNASAPAIGFGTSIVLSVPLSVASSRLLFVTCGTAMFGIPMHGIARLYRLDPHEIESAQGKPIVTLDGRKLPLFSLANLLQVPSSGDPGRSMLFVLLLKVGSKRAAILVDGFPSEQEGFIQDLGVAGGISNKIAGGTLLGDGSVAIVLNPAGLMEAVTRSEPVALPAAAVPPSKPAVRILVADDSLTSRSLERSVLEASGYRVSVAVDGAEALDLIRADPPDLVISDLEMPRMNGFELLEALKADPALSHVPVIIVSSVEKLEEKAKGLALGAGAYIVKRKFDQHELLDTIRLIL